MSNFPNSNIFRQVACCQRVKISTLIKQCIEAKQQYSEEVLKVSTRDLVNNLANYNELCDETYQLVKNLVTLHVLSLVVAPTKIRVHNDLILTQYLTYPSCKNKVISFVARGLGYNFDQPTLMRGYSYFDGRAELSRPFCISAKRTYKGISLK